MTEKLLKHNWDPPPPIQQLRPDINPPVATIVHRLLMKKPEERYQTPAELADALTVALDPTAAVAPEEIPMALLVEMSETGAESCKARSLSRHRLQIIGAGSVLLLVAVLLSLAFRSNASDTRPTSAPSSRSTEARR
jgi:hypothetical protein